MAINLGQIASGELAVYKPDLAGYKAIFWFFQVKLACIAHFPGSGVEELRNYSIDRDGQGTSSVTLLRSTV